MCNIALEKPCFYFDFVGGIVEVTEPATGQPLIG